MAAHQDVAVLKFNPWLFSGTEQLAAHFFHEIAAQLHESSDKKLQEAGEKLMGYSEALSPLSAVPFIGKWAERVAGAVKASGEVLKRQGGAPGIGRSALKDHASASGLALSGMTRRAYQRRPTRAGTGSHQLVRCDRDCGRSSETVNRVRPRRGGSRRWVAKLKGKKVIGLVTAMASRRRSRTFRFRPETRPTPPIDLGSPGRELTLSAPLDAG